MPYPRNQKEKPKSEITEDRIDYSRSFDRCWFSKVWSWASNKENTVKYMKFETSVFFKVKYQNKKESNRTGKYLLYKLHKVNIYNFKKV